MSNAKKILGTEEAWEDGTLGADSAHAKLATPEQYQAVQDALNLQPISIRLQKETIDLFKAIAQLEGIGYQPLMRIALTRYAECEAKRLVIAQAGEKKAKAKENQAKAEKAEERKAA